MVAVRTAEIRERLELLNDELDRELRIRLGVRTGIATGEVLVDEESGEGLTASGDTMNVAARLEQAATAGEILIGAQTRVLGGDAIVVDDIAPLELKGKAQPVEAFRLLRVVRGDLRGARAPHLGWTRVAQAIELYERKGDVVSAARARERTDAS